MTPSNPIPRPAGPAIRIETERLILRPYGVEHFEALHAIASDPAMFLHSERGPMSSDEAWSRLLRHVGHWQVAGYGVFAIEDKKTGRLVGETGLTDFRRGLGSRFDGCPEITWSVAADVQRRGYATEAAEAALRWLDETLEAPRSVCLIHIDNQVSLRLAEKLGYRPFHRQDYKGYPAVLLERDRGARGR
ncbi:MAG TPA: GNAT family N-acetyltransferase [Allosphingosinicella sp.]|nr:GNAT family N-acetyltransferase [Allosphingosinicella sp.]